MLAALLSVYCIVLFITLMCGMWQYKIMDKATKLMVWYIGITCLFEGMAFGASIIFKNNLLVYHILSPIRFSVLYIYFSKYISVLKKKNIGCIIAALTVLFSLINSIFIQRPPAHNNTNFIILESFLTITLVLLCYYELLDSDEMYLHHTPQFWFSSLLLVFWSFTFFYWLVGIAFIETLAENAIWMSFTLWAINILIYTGFAIVFLSYKKMQRR